MATQAANEDIFHFEGYTLDLRRACLHAGDREIELRPKSFEMLRYLVENAGRLVSKDELIKAVWPNVTVADESLTRCVSDVRLALGDADQRIIKTLLRRGYLFAAPVSAGPMGGSATSGRPPGGPISDFISESSLTASTEPTSRSAPRLSLVVLPFANLSGDSAQDYLADVITEGLTAYLSRVRDSFVIARTSALAYKGKAADVKQIGQELGVRYILKGSVQQSARRVRVSAQLVDAHTGAHIWADRFDADRVDLSRCRTKSLRASLARCRSNRPPSRPRAFRGYARQVPTLKTWLCTVRRSSSLTACTERKRRPDSSSANGRWRLTRTTFGH
jgi:adenylate cyclase